MKKHGFDTQKLVLLALLTAIVIVLQLLASFLPVYPFKLNLVLIPTVVGAALISPLAGAWLGFVFGVTVLSADRMLLTLFGLTPVTIIVVLARGILFGAAAGYVYKLLSKKGETIAVISAAVVAPIVNTGIFVLGLYMFFIPVIMAQFQVDRADIASFIFLGMIGINFPLEFGINLVLSPTIIRLVQYGQSKLKSGKE